MTGPYRENEAGTPVRNYCVPWEEHHHGGVIFFDSILYMKIEYISGKSYLVIYLTDGSNLRFDHGEGKPGYELAKKALRIIAEDKQRWQERLARLSSPKVIVNEASKSDSWWDEGCV